MIDYLFRAKYQVMVFVDPGTVGRAEDIFNRYKTKQTLKRQARKNFTPRGFSIEFDHTNPNKVTLCYLVDSCDVQDLRHALLDNEISGVNIHNPVFTRPYSITSRLTAFVRGSL